MMSMLPARSACVRRAIGACLVLVIPTILCSLAAVAAAQQSEPAKNQLGPWALLSIRGERGIRQEDLANHVKRQIALLKSRLVLNRALRSPAVAKLPVVTMQPDPVTWLEQRLCFDSLVAPEILRVAVKDGPAEERALLVNAVVNAYLQEVVLKEQRVRQTRLAKLKELFADYNAKLHDKRETLRTVMQKQLGDKGGPAAQLDREFAVKQVHAVEKALLDVQAQIRRAQIDMVLAKPMAQAKPADVPVSPAAIEEALRKDEIAARLLAKIGRLEPEIRQCLDRMPIPEADPEYQKRKRAIDDAQKNLAARREVILGQLQQQQWNALRRTQQAAPQRIEQLRKVEEMLSAERKTRLQAVQQRHKSTEAVPDLDWLRDEMRQVHAVTEEIGRQIHAMEVETQAPQRISILEEAAVPGK